MGRRISDGSESRFAAYVEGIVEVIGHADRAGPLSDYCVGLMMPGERKSVEPMAAVTAPARTAAQHQSLLHFVGQAGLVGRRRCWPRCVSWCCRRWSATDRSRHGSSTTPAFRRKGSIRSGWRGNTAANSASRTIARSRYRCRSPTITPACRWPIGCICRRTGLRIANGVRKAGVPDEIGFKTKPEIALEQIRGGLRGRIARGVVLMDAGYGCNTDLRTGISALGLRYVAGILPQHFGVGAGHGTAAAEEVVGARATTEAHSPRRQASTGLGQGACARLAQARLAHDHVARGHGRAAVLALCPRARSCRAS